LGVVQLLSFLLPDPIGLQLVGWQLDPAQALIGLNLRSQQTSPSCPRCRVPAERVHSHYQRRLADLPWGDWSVRLGLTVRKFFCDNPHCGRRIFTERLPEVVAPWARKTVRLCQRLTAIAAALGGAAGSRLSHLLDMPAARNTLLRLIRAAPLPSSPAPAVLGVDDWAYRKGHTYGTVLVDLERRRPITLWDGRDADTLAQWLREHPGVEVVARDRASAYAEGVRRSAPHAVQVADRFHLLQNLAETLQSALSTQAARLRAVEPVHPAAEPDLSVRPAPPQGDRQARLKAATRRERQLALYRQIWALHREGWPKVQIARQLGLGYRIVSRYLRHEHFPERQGRCDAGHSRLLEPWKPLLLERWNAGHRHSGRLFGELRGRGYRGSYATLARYTRRLRQAQARTGPGRPGRPRRRLAPMIIDRPPRPLSPRNVTWLVLRRAEDREAEGAEQLQRLRGSPTEVAEAIGLAEGFLALVRTRAPEELEPWLVKARASTLAAFRHFAEKLETDVEAVQAAVSLPWSNGPVEGQISRLKMLKRQMYGRANLDLLNRRFLLLSAVSPKVAKNPI
jgi:transposase